MADAAAQYSFRGLPLTRELTAMLRNMLEPPRDEDGGPGTSVEETRSATERATPSIDGTMGPIGANEERNAAMETGGMKGSRR
ncbi:hypothetical protein CUJ87_31910 (plasmid) [Paraburkholderia caledonica]|nr:hypothetical protein [Paraburkholderia caledonica]AXF18945.1 hypothetical protein CUJ87_31910 [Paraburkholderia caledonica]